MAETVEEFENIGPVEMDKLLGEQKRWIYGIAKGPLTLEEWHKFVEWAVGQEVALRGRENADISWLNSVWLKASITFIEMGKIAIKPPDKKLNLHKVSRSHVACASGSVPITCVYFLFTLIKEGVI